MSPEALPDLVDAIEEVGPHAVHLVDEDDPRDAIFVRLAPDGFGLRLDRRDRVEQSDEAVEDPQRALDLDREVHVARRIDDVDARVAPGARGGGRRDRDAALLLLDHPVHGRSTLVHLAHLVRAPGVKQNALGRGRLARVDVSRDPDVSGPLQRILSCHVDYQR